MQTAQNGLEKGWKGSRDGGEEGNLNRSLARNQSISTNQKIHTTPGLPLRGNQGYFSKSTTVDVHRGLRSASSFQTITGLDWSRSRWFLQVENLSAWVTLGGSQEEEPLNFRATVVPRLP